MKLDDRFLCPACATVFRPLRDEDLCPKCAAAELRRLEEIEREADVDFAIRCAQ